MNWDQISGEWKKFKGSVQQEWGKLTDDEVDVIAGDRQKLEGQLQKSYGMAKEDAERAVDDWMSRNS